MIFRHCKIIAVFTHDCDSLRFLYMSTVASAKKKMSRTMENITIIIVK